MPEYIVTTKNQDMSVWQTDEVSTLLSVLFEYYGQRKEILIRALVGCHTVPEMVEMYNCLMPFYEDKIERIREVKERIYG